MSVIGTVRRYLPEKRFGFLTRDDGRPDVFVHRDELLPPLVELREGQRVEFDVLQQARGPAARRVREFVKADPDPYADDE